MEKGDGPETSVHRCPAKGADFDEIEVLSTGSKLNDAPRARARDVPPNRPPLTPPNHLGSTQVVRGNCSRELRLFYRYFRASPW